MENFAKTGKVREIYPNYWKIILENGKESGNGKVGDICQPVVVKTIQMWYNTIKTKKLYKYWNTAKNTGKSGKRQGNL